MSEIYAEKIKNNCDCGKKLADAGTYLRTVAFDMAYGVKGIGTLREAVAEMEKLLKHEPSDPTGFIFDIEGKGCGSMDSPAMKRLKDWASGDGASRPHIDEIYDQLIALAGEVEREAINAYQEVCYWSKDK